MHLWLSRPSILVLIAFLLSAVGLDACQVPVFRFALERWDADPFTVAVSPPGEDAELDAQEQEVVAFLRRAEQDESISANLSVRDGERTRERQR